jgi:alkylated DNA repair protein (DNA oxidative demethylase)
MPDRAPRGFRYVADFVTEAEEAELLAQVARLPFRSIRMRGQVARRRAAHFGWIYGYESGRIEPGPAIPPFLEPLRARAAVLIGEEPGALSEVLVTDYPPGAGIGWHQDASMFGEVVGVSLFGACRMEFAAEGTGARPPAAVVALAPRSAYVLDGPARWAFRHRIPPGTSARYSITLRTLRFIAR